MANIMSITADIKICMVNIWYIKMPLIIKIKGAIL